MAELQTAIERLWSTPGGVAATLAVVGLAFVFGIFAESGAQFKIIDGLQATINRYRRELEDRQQELHALRQRLVAAEPVSQFIAGAAAREAEAAAAAPRRRARKRPSRRKQAAVDPLDSCDVFALVIRPTRKEPSDE